MIVATKRKNLYKIIEETIECKCCAVALLRHALHERNPNAGLKCHFMNAITSDVVAYGINCGYHECKCHRRTQSNGI